MVARTSRITTLQVALGLSLAVHAGVLTLRFVAPQTFERMLADTPLEVILVNARSNEAPVKAQAIAQANLAGGGEAAQGRATSPLAASAEVRLGDTSHEARKRIDRMLQEQMQLLAQMRREVALMPPEVGADQGTPEQQAERERRRQMIKQLAEIEKRINEENARPRKRYVSPATSEAIYAVYYDAMRRKIEDRGTRDFPEVQGRKLYGELTINVTVDARGRVVEVKVVRPSQSRLLDQRAMAIVRSAAPFGAFTNAMRRETDQIVVTSRFRFTREDGFETQTLGSTAQGQPP
ncbi:MAG: TonB family protein [Betaproteobacteria bacterium]